MVTSIRYVIEYGTRVKHLKVEVYKIGLKLCVYPNINDFENHSFSQADKISKNTIPLCIQMYKFVYTYR